MITFNDPDALDTSKNLTPIRMLGILKDVWIPDIIEAFTNGSDKRKAVAKYKLATIREDLIPAIEEALA